MKYKILENVVMATNGRNREIERERKSGSSIYICLIVFENPLFDTSGILTLEREIERERNKINYN